MAVEHIKHWTIGDVQVTRLVEVNEHTDPFTMLSAECEPDAAKHHDWLAPNFATPEGIMKISFQAFAMKTPDRTIIIDTCIGEGREREFFSHLQSDYLTDLAAAGYDTDAVDIVLCTHLHFDHVGWNTRLVDGKWVPTFPNARYLFGKTEYDHWKAERDGGGEGHWDHWDDAVEPVVAAGLVDLIEPNHQVCPEVSLFPTPGHTPGHVSVLIESAGERAVITGDLMHHPIQLARPDFKVNADSDKDQGVATRTAFCERFADSDVTVIGSHFCEPTSGRIVSDETNWRLKLD